MNNHLLEKCIELTRTLKPRHISGKSFHVSAACLKNRIICVGWNDYRVILNQKKWGAYVNTKNLPGKYIPSRHSETHLCQRLGEDYSDKIEIVNVRVGANDKVLMSCPCFNCQRSILPAIKYRRFFYSNDQGGFEEF